MLQKKTFHRVAINRIDYKRYIGRKLLFLKSERGKHETIEKLLFGKELDVVEHFKSKEGTGYAISGGMWLEINPRAKCYYALHKQFEETKDEFFKLIYSDIENNCLANKGDCEVPALKIIDFLEWYKANGYEVPNGLVEAIEEGDIAKGAKLLKTLRKCFIFRALMGKKRTLPELREELPIESYASEDTIAGSEQETLIGSSGTKKTGNEITEPVQSPQPTFENNGATWSVGIDKIRQVKESKGMGYIKLLLDNPRKSFSVLEMSQLGDEAELRNNRLTAQEDKNFSDEDNSFEVPGRIDALNKEGCQQDEGYKEIKRLMLETSEDLNIARQNQDEAEITKLEEEFEKLNKIRGEQYDKFGRPREANKSEQNQRTAVKNAIERAKNNILNDETLKNFAEILSHIKTGFECIYNPPIQKTVSILKAR
jgi:hypothetical protein